MADTCTHEAGHAVMAWYFGRRLESVSIDGPDGARCGYANPLHGASPDTGPDDVDAGRLDARDCHHAVMIALAGGEACRLAGEADFDDGADEDALQTFDVCERISRSPEEASALRDWLRERTRAVLRLPSVWPAVIALAARLRKESQLSGAAAEAEIFEALRIAANAPATRCPAPHEP